MVSEGRNLPSVQGGRKRVDLLLIDSGDLPAHAVELLIFGSKDEMHEHWRRAVDVYQKLYAHGNVPCTIQVTDQRQPVARRNQLKALHCTPHRGAAPCCCSFHATQPCGMTPLMFDHQ